MSLAPLLLAFFLGCLGSQHIDLVVGDALPEVHQQELITSLLNLDKRRAILESSEFFRLTGVYKDERTRHDFILKLAYSSSDDLKVTVDKVDTVVEVVPIFHGYLVEDYQTIISLSFPYLGDGDATPIGMMHHSNGEHYSLSLSEDFGIAVVDLEPMPEGVDIPRPQCNTSNDHQHTADIDELVKKRQTGENGLPLSYLPLLEIDFVVETDVIFFMIHNYDTQAAINYILTLVATTNTFYERDIRARLTVRSIGLHTSNAPASDLDTLNAYLISNPALGKLADIALILQGNGNGGLAYVGTVCGQGNTGHASSKGAYGSNRWDAPEDLIMLAHEAGHIIGSPHTHDPYGYNPVIDTCGSSLLGSSIPPEGGSLMSYCHLTSGSVGYTNIKFYFGRVGMYGYHSERVPQRIRATLESRTCLSIVSDSSSPTNPTPSSTPNAPIPNSGSQCSDVPNPRWSYSSGNPLRCSVEASLGRCSWYYNSAPYCMASCGRCGASNKLARAPTENITASIDFSDFYPGHVDVTNGTVVTDDKCSNTIDPTLKFSDHVNRTCDQLSGPDFCKFVTSRGHYCKMSCSVCIPDGRSIEGFGEEVVEVPRQLLFNQGETCTYNKGILSTRFVDLGASVRAVDDFVVPAGEAWDLREIKAMGLWFGTFRGVIKFDVSIFHSGTRICKSTAFLYEEKTSVFSLSLESGNCRVVGAYVDPVDNTLISSDEKYYVAVTPVLDFEDGNNIFYWSFSKSNNGDTFLWKDKTDLLGSGQCGSWTEGTSCGLATAGADLCFQLLGWSTPLADDDIIIFNQPQLSNDGDGIIGSESDETRVLSDEEKLQRQAITEYLSELTEKIAQELDQEAELITDIEGTPSWVLPVVILSSFGLVVLFATVGIAVAIIYKFNRGIQSI